MTRTFLQFTLHGRPFGVWENDVASVVRANSLHQLPLSPACVAGMSIIEDRGTTVIDTGACIGLLPQKSEDRASFLLVGDGVRRTGYRVEGSVDTVVCDEDRIFPLPDEVRTEIMRSCAVRGEIIIPIIELGRLQDRISRGIIDVPGPENQTFSNISTDEDDPIRVLTIGRERFCVRGQGYALMSAGADRIQIVPGAQGKTYQVIFHGGAVIPVLPVQEHLGMIAKYPYNGVLVVDHDGNRYALPVTGDHGLLEQNARQLKPMPPLVWSDSIPDAVLERGEVIPRIEIAGMFDSRSGVERDQPLSERYQPDPSFPARFRRESVDIVEVSLFGGKHGIPRDEVREILPYAVPRGVPLSPAIVLGVIERDGKILPVLDLAAIFGKRSPVNDQWKLLRVKNGDFEALVVVEQVLGEKQLPTEIQRQVPIVLPYDVLYGCYLDESVVRLIVNVESLTVHFEKTTIREFMSSLGPEAAAPEEARPQQSAVVPAGSGVKTEGAGEVDQEHLSGGRPSEVAQRTSIDISGHVTMPKAAHRWADRTEPEFASGGEPSETIKEKITQDAMPGESAQENALEKIEQERIEQEQSRLKAEEEQQAAEAARIRAEQERQAAEEARIAEEKKQQELARAQEEERRRSREEALRKEQAERERAARAEAEQREEERLKALQEEKKRRDEEERRKYREAQDAGIREQMQREEEQRETTGMGPRAEKERPASIVAEQSARTSANRAETAPRPERSNEVRNGLIAVAGIAALFLLIFGLGSEKKEPASIRETGPERASREDRTEHVEERKPLQKEQEPPLVLALPKAMPVPEPALYVVVKGDTLWGIAKRFTGNPLNYPRVAKDNSIATPDLIFPGQKIRLKKE